MKGRAVLTLAILVLSIVYGGLVFGQATGGAVTGQVMDPNGAVITSATVRLKNEATGQALNTQTTGSGSFSFPNVLGGDYTLSVEAQGFQPVSQKVNVQ